MLKSVLIGTVFLLTTLSTGAFAKPPAELDDLENAHVAYTADSIDIKGFKFVPKNSVLKIGDTVVWRNKDIVPHTATAKDGSWDSGTIKAGGEWQTTVTTAMLSAYYCRHHPSMTASLAAP